MILYINLTTMPLTLHRTSVWGVSEEMLESRAGDKYVSPTQINVWAAAQGSLLNKKMEVSIKTSNVNIAPDIWRETQGDTSQQKKGSRGHDKNRAASNPSGSYIGSTLICLKMKSLQYLRRIRSKKLLYVTFNLWLQSLKGSVSAFSKWNRP